MNRKFWGLWLLVAVALAACASDADMLNATRPATAEPGPVMVTRVVAQIVTPEPTATTAVCMPLPEGMTLQVVPISDSAFTLELSGLLEGESLVFTLTSEAPDEAIRREDQPVVTVGPDGRASRTFNLDYPPFTEWQVQVIHARGVACFELSLPLTESFMVGTAVTATPAPQPVATFEPTPEVTLEDANYILRTHQPLWFAQNGALWRSDIHGVETEQLTDDNFLSRQAESIGRNVILRLSPDGRWLAHAPDAGGVYLIDLATRQLVNLPVRVWDLAWSPDGRFLAYAQRTRINDCAICLYDVITGEVTALVAQLAPGAQPVYNLVWSSDGARLAYACCFTERQPYDGFSDGQIQVVTIATGMQEIVGETTSGVAGGPGALCWTWEGEVTTEWAREKRCAPTVSDLFEALSRDNLLAAWEGLFTDDNTWRSTRLFVTNRATGQLVWERELPVASTLRLAWSPDGRYLFFDDSEMDSPIWRVTADNSELEELFDDAYLLGIVDQWQALVPPLTLSPDGHWQVTVAISEPAPVEAGEVEQFPTGEKYHVSLVADRTDGSVSWTAVDEWRSWGLGWTYPAPLHWAADGRSLYFTNVPVPDGCVAYVNGGDLWRLDLTDGSVTQILPFVGLVLALSPDATQLAYAGAYGHGFILRDLASGEEQTVTLPEYTKSWAIGGLQWSPDGQTLLLTQVLNYCLGEPATAIVRVDVVAGTAETVVEPDERNFTILEWLREDEVRLLDDEGRIWYLEVFSGEIAGGQTP